MLDQLLKYVQSDYHKTKTVVNNYYVPAILDQVLILIGPNYKIGDKVMLILIPVEFIIILLHVY